MTHFVHNLRNRSREAKERILLLISLITFIILIGVWIMVLGTRSRTETATKEVHQAESPFAILGESITNALHNFKQ